MNGLTPSHCTTAVHPRVCGEHLSQNIRPTCSIGSSPRMWGTLLPALRPRPAVRFIPAYVGNIAQRRTAKHEIPVHPRVCGEHRGRKRVCIAFNGSSPRMWGTYGFARPGTQVQRFIPAYVGNIPRPRRSASSSSVHPRVCGEHHSRHRPQFPGLGSSPRMWGTSRDASRVRIPQRFIPAYVGNIRLDFLRRHRIAVHPRVCGEHSRLGHHQRGMTGSSPRMWGTSISEKIFSNLYRFIPAYVGNIAWK